MTVKFPVRPRQRAPYNAAVMAAWYNMEQERLRRLSSGAGTPPVVVPDLPTTGLISEWRFDEGSGNTVADQVGSNDIDLTDPPNPNTTWTSRGITTTNGAVWTPNLTNVRTIAQLVKVERSVTSGFVFAGGQAPNTGATAEFVRDGDVWHVGMGAGISPIRRRSTGQGVVQMNHGGWCLVFRELDAQYTDVYAFGGRANTVESGRLASGEIGWMVAYSTQLSDQDREDIYGYVRDLVKGRGIRIDYRDCATTYHCQLIWGQSNADGRALITSLSAPDQAATTPSNVKIAAINANGDEIGTIDDLEMGVNQQDTDPSSDFGPEMGLAWEWEDNEGASGNVLAIFKAAQGSTFLAPSSLAEVSSGGVTWNKDEVETGSMFQQMGIKGWYQVMAELLNNDIGPRLRGILWWQGGQDAQSVNTSLDYDVHVGEFWTELKNHCGGFTGLHMVLYQYYEVTVNVQAAYDEVRADQASFAAANSDVTLVTISDLTFADNVHPDGPGAKTAGERGYTNKGWSV